MAGFSLLSCCTDASICSDESHSGKGPDNITAGSVWDLSVVCFHQRCPGLVLSFLGFRLSEHGEILKLSSCPSCFWLSGSGQVPPNPSIPTDTGVRDWPWVLPCQKQEQRPSPWKQSQNSTPTPSTLQFLACSRVIYAKQLGMESICLDTERYNCRSYQKDAVYVSKLLTWCEAIVWNLISRYMHLRARLRSEGGHQWIFQHCVVLFHMERIQFVWSTVWTKMK